MALASLARYLLDLAFWGCQLPVLLRRMLKGTGTCSHASGWRVKRQSRMRAWADGALTCSIGPRLLCRRMLLREEGELSGV